MTIREYISSRFRAFNLTEAHLLDIAYSSGLDLDETFDAAKADMVGRAMISAVEEYVLAPRLQSVNESGFSLSWDFATLGKYYLWLCRRYGVSADSDTLQLLGISTITDKTDIW